MSRPPVRPWLGELLPALVVTGLTAVAMSRQVRELDGNLAALSAAGLGGIAVARVALWLVTRAEVAASPTLSPTAPFPPPDASKVGTVLPAYAATTVAGFEAFSLPKLGSSDDENEDSWMLAESRGFVAVSDGASSSFGARVWSRALVDAAIADDGAFEPSLFARCVERAATEWTAHHTQGVVAWWAQEGLRRGAFATLLAMTIGDHAEGRGWTALAVGDSCVLHLRPSAAGWELLRSFPVESAAGFGSHPDLLSSVNMPAASPVGATGILASGDVLVAATDAVSEWLLGDTARLGFAADAPLGLISETVSTARVSRSMVNDDATFVRYREH